MIEDSATWWFPKIKDIDGINVPKTEMVAMDEDMAITLLASTATFINEYGPMFEKALQRFTFPVFIRTDEMARKHDWKNTCFVKTRDDFYRHVRNLAADSTRIGEQCRAIMIREFLKLESPFECFNGMPVSRERRRYFIDGGDVACHHAYWHEIAFGFLSPEYKRRLEELNHEPSDEVALLSGMARRVAREFPGAFSVDFARDVRGTWWLIDMATAGHSWHEPSCPHRDLK